MKELIYENCEEEIPFDLNINGTKRFNLEITINTNRYVHNDIFDGKIRKNETDPVKIQPTYWPLKTVLDTLEKYNIELYNQIRIEQNYKIEICTSRNHTFIKEFNLIDEIK